MRRILLFALLSSVGCRDVTKVTQRNVGLFIIEAAPSAAVYKARPEGRFYRSGGVSLFNSATARDECTTGSYPAPPPPDLAGIPGVDAGATVALSLSGAMATLARGTLPGTTIRTYTLPGPSDSITFQPGDTAAFAIPGTAGGFGPATFRVKTAETFTVTSVPITPPTASPATLTIRWSAPPVPGSGSAMLVSLRYARAGSATVDSQVSCVLTDSGTSTLNDFLVAGWYASTVHQAEFSRVRTVFQGAGDDILAGLAFTTVRGTY
ncbi:MAG: hypothetical protein NVS4B3_06400 [Gemmatimonadaceae bacterium]